MRIRKAILFIILGLFVIPSGSIDAVSNTWMRIDGDPNGVYVWFGGSSRYGTNDWVHEIIYFPTDHAFEAEIGPVFSLIKDQLDLVCMFGPLWDLSAGEMSYLIPQVYLYYDSGPWYGEAWNLLNIGTAGATSDDHSFYGRYLLKYALKDQWACGPHLEWTYDFSSGSLSSFPVGVVLGIDYGQHNSLDIFIGSDIQNKSKIFTRFTFYRDLDQ